MTDDLNNKAGREDLRGKFDASAKPFLTVDVEKYQSYLDGSGLSDKQKEAFLQALWSVITSFVEMGFGVHPLQEACGQEPRTDIEDTKAEMDDVSSKHPKKKTSEYVPRSSNVEEVE